MLREKGLLGRGVQMPSEDWLKRQMRARTQVRARPGENASAGRRNTRGSVTSRRCLSRSIRRRGGLQVFTRTSTTRSLCSRRPPPPNTRSCCGLLVSTITCAHRRRGSSTPASCPKRTACFWESPPSKSRRPSLRIGSSSGTSPRGLGTGRRLPTCTGRSASPCASGTAASASSMSWKMVTLRGFNRPRGSRQRRRNESSLGCCLHGVRAGCP